LTARRSTTVRPLGWRAAVASIVLPLVLIASLELFLRQCWGRDNSAIELLRVRPSPDRVYVLGNSIMKTAFDLERAEEEFGGGIDAEIHFGHFTNLWYLLVKNAIVPAPPHPRLIVWGFLPNKARRPAIRMRLRDHTDLARRDNEYEFDRIASGALNNSRRRPMQWLVEHSLIFSGRAVIADRLPMWLDTAGVASLQFVGYPSSDLPREKLGGGSALTDLLVRRLGAGELVMPEERIAGIGWIQTEERPFANTFVPRIAERIKAAGIPQLVVMFRSSAFKVSKRDRQADREYVSEAIRYFEERGIPFLDFVNSSTMDRRYFAAGSHINETGRKVLTPLLVRQLRVILDAPKAARRR
jgi:hypothetical protein